MKPILELLEQLASLDIKLSANQGKLRVNAPQNTLTESLRADLVARKEELLEFLLNKKPVILNRPIRLSGVRQPLSFGQERLWSLARIGQNSSRYNMPLVFEIIGKLDISAFERSLDILQRRHAVMRTAFPGDNLGTAVQEVQPETAYCLPVTDLFLDLVHLSKSQAETQLKNLLETEIRRHFNIAKAPLWRAHLYRLSEKRHMFVFVTHHLIFDGVSQSIFLQELSDCYQAFSTDKNLNLAPLAFEFTDFAAWQRANFDKKVLERQRIYWAETLAGDLSPLVVPNDKPRSLAKSHAAVRHFRISRSISQKLFEVAHSNHVSPYVMLSTAFFAVMHCFSEQEDLIVCSPTSGRDHADLENLIGYFNGLVVLRLNLSRDPTLREIINRVRKISLEALNNQSIPIQEIAQFPNLIRIPLTRAMFSYQDAVLRELKLRNLEVNPVNLRKDAADFELAMYAQEDKGAIVGLVDFNTELFSEDGITKFLAGFEKIITIMTTNLDTQLSALPKFKKSNSFVENVLVKHPQIEKAVVVTDKVSGQLVAYLVLDENNVPALEVIRSYVSDQLPDYLIPAFFVPIDKFPLLPDGSINLENLSLLPTGNRRQFLAEYVAPRTELELKLAAIWKRVLWLDRDVGIYDRFRELGGHSLLYVQLIIQIEEELQCPFSAKVLASLDTVAAMAAAFESASKDPEAENSFETSPSGLHESIYQGLLAFTASWEGERQSPGSVIVGLNTNGSKQKLFWCLQREYELSQLARYLGSDQPVYGMRSGNKVMIKSQENIEKLARHYVSEILQIQPQGPYVIGGNCQAAKIAFEIATQIKAHGHEITVLFLHEKFIPKHYADPIVITFGCESDRNPYLYFHDPSIAWRKYYTGPIFSTLVSGGHAEFFQEPNIQVLADVIKKSIIQAQSKALSDFQLPISQEAFQILSEDAYRAHISGPMDFDIKSLETVVLPIKVKNTSASTWKQGCSSGIYLANHWLDARGKVIKFLDGKVPLPTSLEPGHSVVVNLPIIAPEKSGSWILEVDLVEQGMSWFKERGSEALRISVTVKNEHSGMMNFLRRI